MGFFTDGEAASLELSRMSLHIVGHVDDFIAEAELQVANEDFLLDIVREVAADSVYRFEPHSETRAKISEMALAIVGFEAGAQALARNFCRFHGGAAVDGAFFVFEMKTSDQQVILYALVKYDYSQALEAEHDAQGTTLRRIVEAFIGTKSAVQKSAIIRTRNGIVEDELSVRDRMGRPQPNLTDFFRNFLEVARDRNDDDLTAAAKDLVRGVIVANKTIVPSGRIAEAVSRGFGVLRDAETITTDVIEQAVWVGLGQPEEVAVRDKLKKAVTRGITKSRLTDVSFKPAKRVLPRSVKRSVTTNEGVKIEYDTGLTGKVVLEEQLPDGGTKFTVTTRGYRDDVTAEKARVEP